MSRWRCGRVALLFATAIAASSATAGAQGPACPMGQPSRRRTGTTWVEPHPSTVVKRKVPELLRGLGYSIESEDSLTGRVITMPRFEWPGYRSYDPWRHLVHPGVSVGVTVTAVDPWSSISIEVRVLCETGQTQTNRRVLENSPEDEAMRGTFHEVESAILKYFHAARSEVRGRTCAQLNEGDRKIRICGDIARRNADDGDAQLQYALSLIRFFRPLEAKAPLNRALTLLVNRPDAYDTLAGELLRASPGGAAVRELALEVYRQAVDRWPTEQHWHMALGRLLGRVERHAEALDHFERAMVLAPDNPEPPYQAALMLNALERFAEARRHCEIAAPGLQYMLFERPDDVEVWIGLGRCAEIDDRYADATAYFERAVRVDSSRVVADPVLLRVIERSRRASGPRPPAPMPTKP